MNDLKVAQATIVDQVRRTRQVQPVAMPTRPGFTVSWRNGKLIVQREDHSYTKVYETSPAVEED